MRRWTPAAITALAARWSPASAAPGTGSVIPCSRAESRVTLIDGALAVSVLAGVVLNGGLGWWWADPLSALVILAYGLREARRAWAEAG